MIAKELHEKAIRYSKNYLQAEKELLSVLVTMHEKRIFFTLGYTGVFNYCLKALGFSESQAAYFSSIVKKSKEVPELKAAIDAGVLSVSKARRIVPVITKETHKQWIEKASTLCQKELEREVAALNPRSVQERIKPVAATRFELKLGMSDELYKQWRRAMDVVSQKQGKSASMEEALQHLVIFFLERQDPLQRAQRALQNKRSGTENIATGSVHGAAGTMESATGTNSMTAGAGTATGTMKSVTACASSATRSMKTMTRKIPMRLKHEVNLRDKGQCQIPGCDNSRFIHMHHLHPVCSGGEHVTGNLISVCSAHHAMKHANELAYHRQARPQRVQQF